jgi:hypothetical protein
MPKMFRWLGESGIPRKGPALKRDEVHAVADYPAGVVDEWVKTGAAQLIEGKEAPKDEIDTGKKTRVEARGK